MKMKIYMASSWKNGKAVIKFAKMLRNAGHEVDAFCDEATGSFVFADSEIENVDMLNAVEYMKTRGAQRAFKEDKQWLDWADVCLLLLPAGNSAHLEAGYAKGQGKKLVIYREYFPSGEYDVMYGFADLITSSLGELKHYLGLLRRGFFIIKSVQPCRKG